MSLKQFCKHFSKFLSCVCLATLNILIFRTQSLCYSNNLILRLKAARVKLFCQGASLGYKVVKAESLQYYLQPSLHHQFSELNCIQSQLNLKHLFLLLFTFAIAALSSSDPFSSVSTNLSLLHKREVVFKEQAQKQTLRGDNALIKVQEDAGKFVNLP